MRFTDMADEMFGAAQGALPAGVRLATAKRGGVTITRVEIAREGLAKPRGRYVTLGVPVIAAGIPTLMDSDEGADLVVTPRALDSVIAHGSALLAGAINRALQPRLSVAQLFWLAG